MADSARSAPPEPASPAEDPEPGHADAGERALHRLQSLRLAVVDLETSGSNPAVDRITEIGIVLVDGDEITATWSHLVQPDVRIPPIIQGITGIDNHMLQGAPRFAELADTVRDWLGDRIFVAHNVRFDASFLRAEFRRLREPFPCRRQVCTVRLSRQLFPQFTRHGLDALVQRYPQIAAAMRPGETRHRALGDARITAHFYTQVALRQPAPNVLSALQQQLRQPERPHLLEESELQALPQGPGVFTLLGTQHAPLYVGRAQRLRQHLLTLFHGRQDSDEARLVLQARAIEAEATAGEIGARIRELQTVQQRHPTYNRRALAAPCLLVLPAGEGPPQVRPLARTAPGPQDRAYGPFQSPENAHRTLEELARTHELCVVALGFSQPGSHRPCLARQLGRCRGFCCGAESAAQHRERLEAALAPLAFPPWPFPGAVWLEEVDPEGGLQRRWRFDRWCLASPLPAQEDATALADPPFDAELFKLLRRNLQQHPERFEREP